jgi:hypothetical protein
MNYTVTAGEYLSRCMRSAVHQQVYSCDAAPYDLGGKDIWHLLWSDVVSPMRKQYIAEASFAHGTDEGLPCDILCYPIGTNRIEESGFFMEPTILDMTAEYHIVATQTGAYPFSLTTCSAVKVTVGGKRVFSDMRLDRDQERYLSFVLPLQKGENIVRVLINDFAERDTQFYFLLRYEGESPLQVYLPLEVEGARIDAIAAFLDGICTEKFNYGTRDIDLLVQTPPPFPLTAEVCGAVLDSHTPITVRKRTVSLTPQTTRVPVGDLLDRAIGLSRFTITVTEEGVSLSKYWEVELALDSVKVAPAKTVSERKRQELEFLAQHGRENFQKILAMIKTGKTDPALWNDIFDLEVSKVERRWDCSDFRLGAMILAYRSYRSAFPKDMQERLKRVILGFRYWWDEPGTDVMWFFSENHALNFHACELLAGELFPDDVFVNNAMTGREHASKAKRLLVDWFSHFLRYGYTEWNSSVYIPIDLIACFLLYDGTTDAEIHDLACKALDMTFTILAKNSYHGFMASSFGRTYFKNLIGRRNNEASALNFIAFGEGYLNQHCLSTMLFGLSSYEVPEAIADLERQEGEWTDVAGGKPVQLHLLKTQNFILASAENRVPGIHGSQEHMVQFMAGDCDTQIWINHPGEITPFGDGRPSYFAGNGIIPVVRQEHNAVVLSFDIGKEMEVGFTHAFVSFPHFDAWMRHDSCLFFRKGDVWAGLYAQNGLVITEKGPLKGSEVVSPGRKNIWCLAASEMPQDEFIAWFEAKLAGLLTH